ncbi:MAG: hypothetical protein H6672_03335 [Anaerolineaceae bacterium]|nr:hypothetical protein [Anaerolineaceae bacterium]
MSLIICFAGVYIVIGIYGIILAFRGLKAIVRKQATTSYNTIQATWKEVTFPEKPVTLTGRTAVTWGSWQVIGGMLAVVPWLLPMVWPMPLDWWIAITPLVGIGLGMVSPQIYGRRAARHAA